MYGGVEFVWLGRKVVRGEGGGVDEGEVGV